MLLFTPDDSAIAPFQLARTMDLGDDIDDDKGQIVAPTDGTRLFVYQDRVRVRRIRFSVSGLRDFEYLSLEEYLNRELRGGVNPFTFVHGRGWNRIADSSRLDASGWSATGSSPPTVNSRALANVEGYAGSADSVDFDAGQSVLRSSNAFPTGGTTGTVYVSFLVRVDAGGVLSATVNSDGAASAAWTAPDDGEWHERRVFFSDPTAHFLDFEISGGPRTVGLDRIQVTLDEPFPRFEPIPRPTFADCRFIEGSLFATEQHGLFNVEFDVRQEVAA